MVTCTPESKSVEGSTSQYTVQLTSAARAGTDMMRIWSQSGLPSAMAKLNWYYLNNPTARPDVLMIKHSASGNLVGTCSLGYRAMQLKQQRIMVANRCDLAVLAEHRRGQAAPALLEQVRTQGLTRVGLIYGFPNPLAEKSLAVAGFHKLGVFSTYSKVLSVADFVASKLPPMLRFLTKGCLPAMERVWRKYDQPAASSSAKVKFSITRPDASFDALWQTQANSDLLIGVRDRTFLAWRFDQSIYPDLKILAAHDDANSLLGYVAYQVMNGTARVFDFLARPDGGASLRILMTGFFDLARQKGAHVVHMNFFGAPDITQTLQSIGMVRRDGRPIYVAGNMVSKLPRDRYYLTTADEDI